MEIKPIPFLEGYFADSNGDVFFQKNKKKTWVNDKRRRYKRVNINNKKYYVHRLVAMAFHGLPEDGQECCHNDGNSLNNSPDNLRWDTPMANSNDKRKHGTIMRGDNHICSKISEKQTEIIVKCYPLIKAIDLAKYFGLISYSVRAIARGKIRYNNCFDKYYEINKKIGRLRHGKGAVKRNKIL